MVKKNDSRLDWLKFGVFGFLLSIIASATCACANELYAYNMDLYNTLSWTLILVAIILLIMGLVGALFVKNKD